MASSVEHAFPVSLLSVIIVIFHRVSTVGPVLSSVHVSDSISD